MEHIALTNPGAHNMTSKKLSTGIYQITTVAAVFILEKTEDGTWMLNHVRKDGGLDYWQHFASKSACLTVLKNWAGK
jgi:hypothetical protein